MTQSTKFETQTCSRCAGSGNYSYCQMHGTTCFKCGGAGKVYTKRGAAAVAFLKILREVPVETLKVGDLLWQDGFPGSKGSFRLVLSITRGIAKEIGCYCGDGQYETIKIETKGCTQYERPGHMVRKGYSAEEKAEHLAKAYAYQDTLTQAGKPMKRAAKATTAV